jgi:hypothetical protein
MFDELREPKARLNRDKTIRTQSYEAAAAILKQAAQELGQWEEKQSHRLDKPEHADLKNYTVEELYEERRLLLEVQAKMEAFRKPRQPGFIEAAAGSVEEVRNDGPQQ